MYIKYFFLFGILCTSCSPNTSHGPLKPLEIDKVKGYSEKTVHGPVDEYGNLNGNVTLDIDEIQQKEITFKTYRSSDSQLEFMLPIKWEIVDKEGALLFINLENEKDFFVLIAHEKDDPSITLDNYFQTVMELNSEESDNKLINLKTYKQKFNNKFAYMTEWENEDIGTHYTALSCHFEDEKNFFEFALNFEKNEDSDLLNRVLFTVVLQSFVINGGKLFHNGQEKKTVEHIKFDIN